MVGASLDSVLLQEVEETLISKDHLHMQGDESPYRDLYSQKSSICLFPLDGEK